MHRAIQISSRALSGVRFVSMSAARYAKNDASTIDSFRLPSQTSINEWEFKYDFIPRVSEPKVPPITPEAVKQDVAQAKKAEIEREMFNRELTSSVKVEANDAAVVHGGEHVTTEPEYLHDRGLEPVDVSHAGADVKESKSAAERGKYIQSSLNPAINQADVVSLGQDTKIDHKVTPVEKQTQVLDDIEHDNVAAASALHEAEPKKGTSALPYLALFGLGGAGGWYYFSEKK